MSLHANTPTSAGAPEECSSRLATSADTHMAAIVEGAPLAIVTVDRDGRVTQWNAAAELLFGWRADEVIGKTPPSIPPEALEAYRAGGLRLLAGERMSAMETTRLRRDGSRVHVHVSTAPIIGSDGLVSGVAAFYTDISARLEAEEALHESRRRLQTLIDNLPGVAYRCRNDADWTMEYLSDGCEALTGYPPEALLDDAVASYAALIHPLDADRVRQTIQPALAARVPYVLEYRIRTRTGQEKWVWEQGRGVYTDDGTLVALEGFLTDISERKHMEVTARAEERFLASMFDSIQDGLCVLDAEMRIVRANAAMHQWPIAGEGLVGRLCYEAHFGRATPCEDCPSLTAMQTGEAASSIVTRRDDAGRPTVVSEVFAFPLVDADTGRVDGVIEHVRDITARVQAEEALREAHAQMRTLLDASPVAIVSLDAGHQVTSWNPAAEALLGWSASEMIGHRSRAVPPDLVDAWRVDVARIMRGEAIVGQETRRLTRDGGLVDVSLSASPRFDADGAYQGMVVILRDITAQLRADARIQANARRLRAVLAAADELHACATIDEVLRRAVELGRERLGLERCSISLTSDDGATMHGTYGTSMAGETTDERTAVKLLAPKERAWYESLHQGEWHVLVTKGPAKEWDGAGFREEGEIWHATTLIRSLRGRIGVFFNDCAISGAAPDEGVQEAVALYGAMLGNIIERRNSEDRQQQSTEALYTVLKMADELLACDSEEMLLRRAVELPRERLGIERCGLSLQMPDGRMRGTFGTDAEGNTTDERDAVYAPQAFVLESYERARRGEGLWHVSEQALHYWVGNTRVSAGRGWVVATPLFTLSGRIGAFYNDARISGAPLNPVQQDALALYGTLLGSILERKVSEEKQRCTAEGLKTVLEAGDELLACANLEELYQRAVEIPRERLGMMRTELYLRNADGSRMVGTFGTNLLGDTVDLRRASYPTPDDGRRLVEQYRTRQLHWFSEEKTIAEWMGDRYAHVGRGQGALTPIIGPHGRIGTFLNDTGLTGQAVDPLAQDVLALYCSMLGSIIQRRQAEDGLFAEKERLAVTLRSIGDGVITTDRTGRVVLINKVAEAMTGWPQADAAGRQLAEVFHIINERTRELCENPVARVLATSSIVGLANHTMLIARDGAERMLEDSAAPIFDQDSRIVGVVLVFRDVTVERRVLEDIQRADKLQSVGVLAGGIAHDFNNILTAIVGHISLARAAVGEASAAAPALAAAENASLHARDLTRQLLTFAQGGAPVRRAAALGEVIRESVSFANRGANVRADMQVPADLWAAEIDQGQISQVMQNLVINAAQAMPAGGTITIRAENRMAAQADGLPVPEGPCVVITVADQGCGIPPDVLPRVFDPYFTTKPDGTGLGLATAFSVMHRHHGGITVQSRVGEGTTLTLYLPAVPGAHPDLPAAVSRPATLGGRVLVMDDDDIVREVVVALLGALGFEAVETTNGADAIDCYKRAREAGAPFDVVVMDLTIPGAMGGKEAIVLLREIDPDVRAVVSSGYSNDPVMSEYRQFGFRGVIAKPYRMEDLRQVLHEVMRDRTQPASEATP